MFLTIYAPPETAARAGFRSIAPEAVADSLYFARQPDRSLAFCESVLIETDDDALRWRAARAAIALGMLAREGPERRMLYDRALLHARAAVAIAPHSVPARYWLAAAAGRRAHRDEPVLSSRLAMQVHELVTGILADDSTHAGAHHALGMLHAEVARVPTLARFVAARVLRVDLAARASVTAADRHLRRACELEPESVQYLADYAAFLARQRRFVEADAVGRRMALAPAIHPADEITRNAAVAARLTRPAFEPAPSTWTHRPSGASTSIPNW